VVEDATSRRLGDHIEYLERCGHRVNIRHPIYMWQAI
jgi:hypothetical protein